MRCPQLVGRESELADLVAAATEQGGGARLLVGEAGVGKTRLLEQLAEELGDGTVLWGRSSPSNPAPYRPAIEAMLTGIRRWGVPATQAGSPYIGVLGRWIPEQGSNAAQAEVDPMLVGEAVLRFLREWPKPLVAVMEDLHWADRETVSAFEYLAAHAVDSGALLVGTIRTGEPLPSASLLERAAVPLVLHPLTDQQVAQMARLCDPEAPEMPDLARRSGGLPLAVESLLDASSSDARLADVVAVRRSRMLEETQRVLEIAAVVGLEIPVELIASVLPGPPLVVERALAEAAAAELVVRSVSGYRFRHDLIRAAIQKSMADSDIRAIASSAAAQRAERAEWAAAAELWEVAGEGEAAARCHLNGAVESGGAGAFLTAQSALHRAIGLAGPGPLRVEASWELLAVNEALGLADEVERLGSNLAATLEVADPRRALEAQLRVARAFQTAGRWDLAERRLESVRGRAGSEPFLAAMTRLIEARHLLDTAEPGGFRAALRLALEAVDLAKRSERSDLACEALEVAALCARAVDLDESIELLRSMLAVAETQDLHYWRLRAINELGTVEMLRWAVDDRLQEALRRAHETGAVSTMVPVLVNLAAFQAMTGQLEAVLATVDEAEHLMGSWGLPPLRAAAIRLRGLALGYSVGADAMEAEFARAARLAPPQGDALALEWGLGRGMVALLAEDPDAALRAFTAASGDYDPTRVLNPGLGPRVMLRAWRGDAMDAELAEARAGASKGFRWSQMWLDYAQAMVVGRHDREEAEYWFRQADEHAQPYPMFRALAVRRVMEVALKDGWGSPADALRDLLVTCEDRRMLTVGRACRDLLRQAGERAPRLRGRDMALPAALRRLGITAREAEVLELIRRRLTNREIADLLFISPRTVEKHVASLMLKTGAADRVSLSRFAPEHQDGG